MQLLIVLSLAMGGCTITPVTPTELSLVAEPANWVEEEVVVKNLDRQNTLIIGDITFEPDTAPVRWTGPGPFEIEPGQKSFITVRFSPETVGTWNETLTFTTNAGDLTVPISLVARVGVDLDGDGFSVNMGDCNDLDAAVNPDGIESCNEIDDDCDGEADEDFDVDNDGFLDMAICPHGLDCNDNDRTAYPGRDEECDQTDSDCNGIRDDIQIPAELQQGVCEGALKVCPKFGGPIEPNYDLIDGFQSTETGCDELDNDCDGRVDVFDYQGDGTLDCIDDDGDGYSEVQGDCDDGDATLDLNNCGARKMGIVSLAGLYTLDLNLWTIEHYAFMDGATQGVAVDSETILLANRYGLLTRELYLGPTSWTLTDTSYEAQVMSILHDPNGAWNFILLRDGRLIKRHLDGTEDETVNLIGDLWAMTLDEDTLWVCSTNGILHQVDTNTLDYESANTFSSCYAPPVVDTRFNRILVNGYRERQITALRINELSQGTIVPVEEDITRGTMVGDEYWAIGGTGYIQIRADSDLGYSGKIKVVEGPLTGLWYDSIRNLVWVAVQDTQELVAYSPVDKSEVTRIFVTTGIDLFPIDP